MVAPRPRYAALLDRIGEHLARLGVSERRACTLAGLGVDAIRNIRRGRAPRAETLHRLAPVLGVSTQDLSDTLNKTVPPNLRLISNDDKEGRDAR